ncbi:hypothetical protein [Yinghuangia sp. YIM S09857]|uniref:hypothetical protein n=1 Tax=Yinghuangia sp. YIM S09857 TaxID=3436929 RepID=UPI003F538F59
MGWDGREAVGYAHGATLPERSRWWRATEPPLSAADAAEDGARTIVVFDTAHDLPLPGTRLH